MLVEKKKGFAIDQTSDVKAWNAFVFTYLKARVLLQKALNNLFAKIFEFSKKNKFEIMVGWMAW